MAYATSIYLTLQQKELIKRAADSLGMGYTTYMKAVAFSHAKKTLKKLENGEVDLDDILESSLPRMEFYDGRTTTKRDK